MRNPLIFILCGISLIGCEQLGIETPAQVAAAHEAEGRAIGGACRHSGRALEDCYTLNPKGAKAAIFSGWRDMDAYMRENNIEVVPALLPRAESGRKKRPAAAETEKAEEPAPKKEGAGEAQTTTDPPAEPAKGRKQA